MSLPAVVPLPASLEAGSGAPFRLSSATTAGGETDAAAALAAIVEARTGLRLVPSASAADLELRVDPSTSSGTGSSSVSAATSR